MSTGAPSRTVLGIDAAWTEKNASGIALIQEHGVVWSLVAVAPSVREFAELSQSELNSHSVAGPLLRASAALTGVEPVVVAVDMPLATVPIAGRRISDDAVSRAYGARKCATHSPTAERPGAISERLKSELMAAGYPLRTTAFEGRGLVEVYPHPALVELARAQERLPYKVSRTRAYWPQACPAERRERLLTTWLRITDLLDEVIAGSRAALEPFIASGRLKAAEDALDAVVCAWVGSCVLDGRAIPFGDESSAIWIPEPASS